MRLHSIIASSLASISIALAMTFGNKHQHSKHHVRRTHFTKTRTLFAQPPCQNEFGFTSRSKASRTASKQSSTKIIDNCAEKQKPTPQHLSSSTKQTRKQTPKKRIIRHVSWAGKRGMLPHQYYSGVLDYEEYHHWLRLPLNENAQIPTNNYFSTASSTSPSASTSIGNTTATCIKQIEPPQVKSTHLKPIYIDEHIIVVNKPSGVLSVPGPRRHECAITLAYRYFGKSKVDYEANHNLPMLNETSEAWQPLTAADSQQIDTMVVHRLDRDTSGVLMFARNDNALKQLHSDFKDKMRQRVNKRYVALVCGHWTGQTANSDSIAIDEGEIDLPLVRDMEHPPFMRVATAETSLQQQQLKQQSQTNEQEHLQEQKKDQNNEQQRRQHSGYLRMVGKGAKASLTTYRILSYEYLVDDSYDCKDSDDPEGINTSPRLLPVTRVELIPVTGRTHQLRVHCAAVGHPIVGDSIYGYQGEGSPHGGLMYKAKDEASVDLQRNIYNYWMRRHQNYGKQSHQHMGEHNNAKPNDYAEEECMLCLHAYQLTISHPVTESPMMFECAPNF